ncbi:hypothetical protein [Citrobacter portucalensis]|uniref:hypothetical protein n=1 Tax=Citrobacter portucalensis TaxID=1639133 RepID=UPI0022433F60|nr:hypothetical protein [Citrobacter portucalensis]MCW8354087.1 hypothetical protein [Citrobacter portucalensis]MCX9044620.1 hypothetical protein [Citrobacter portucalensis]
MLDIMQDDDGVILVNGDFVLDGGIEGVAQQAEIRVATNRGEWWLDTSQGLPWLPGIMGSRLPASIVSNMINAEAKRTPGVTDARATNISDVKGDFTIRFAVYIGNETKEVSSGIS